MRDHNTLLHGEPLEVEVFDHRLSSCGEGIHQHVGIDFKTIGKLGACVGNHRIDNEWPPRASEWHGLTLDDGSQGFGRVPETLR